MTAQASISCQILTRLPYLHAMCKETLHVLPHRVSMTVPRSRQKYHDSGHLCSPKHTNNTRPNGHQHISHEPPQNLQPRPTDRPMDVRAGGKTPHTGWLPKTIPPSLPSLPFSFYIGAQDAVSIEQISFFSSQNAAFGFGWGGGGFGDAAGGIQDRGRGRRRDFEIFFGKSRLFANMKFLVLRIFRLSYGWEVGGSGEAWKLPSLVWGGREDSRWGHRGLGG